MPKTKRAPRKPSKLQTIKRGLAADRKVRDDVTMRVDDVTHIFQLLKSKLREVERDLKSLKPRKVK